MHMYVKFTWDENKAELVKRDHNIDFNKIKDIFEDSYAVEYEDEAHSTQFEKRYCIIGLTAQ